MAASRIERIIQRTFIDFRQTREFLKNPLIFEKAEGLYYYDTNNKRYFDGLSGVYVVGLGHGNKRVLDYLRAQLDKLTFAPPLHGISNITIDYIEKLGQVAPGNLQFVKTCSGGSEAVESTLKFARQYHKQTGNPGKFKIVSRYQAFHGSTFGGMAASGTGAKKTKFEPHLAGFLKVFPPSHYYRHQNETVSWKEANLIAAQSVEDVIVAEDPATVAAVIVEPIANSGIMTPTPEYLQKIREICDRHQVLLIFDEVITGFGKTGHMFAAETFGVTPDLIAAGKAMSNGVIPMAAMFARLDLAEAFLGEEKSMVHFAHGHTFGGNPLASAVGIAVLEELQERNLPARATEMGEYLASELKKLEHYGVTRNVRGRGLLRGVDIVQYDKAHLPDLDLAQELKQTALKNGLIIRVDAGWFAVCPPLISTKEDIDELVRLVDKSIQDAIVAVNKRRGGRAV